MKMLKQTLPVGVYERHFNLEHMMKDQCCQLADFLPKSDAFPNHLGEGYVTFYVDLHLNRKSSATFDHDLAPLIYRMDVCDLLCILQRGQYGSIIHEQILLLDPADFCCLSTC